MDDADNKKTEECFLLRCWRTHWWDRRESLGVGQGGEMIINYNNSHYVQLVVGTWAYKMYL